MENIGRLSPEKLMARMQVGILYSAADLSKKVHVDRYLVRAMLLKLERAEMVVQSKRRDGCACFALSGTTIEPEAELPKATPLIPHLMTGELAGYDATIERRRALCMSVRRTA